MHLLCTNYVFSDLELNYKFWESSSLIRKITPHLQRELGKVIGVGVHIYIKHIMFVDKIILQQSTHLID